MGQAKNRGTEEQRIKEGIEKKEAREKLQAELNAAREAAMTPEQRAKRNYARTVIALASGIGVGSFFK
jgi:hypothetical protein